MLPLSASGYRVEGNGHRDGERIESGKGKLSRPCHHHHPSWQQRYVAASHMDTISLLLATDYASDDYVNVTSVSQHDHSPDTYVILHMWIAINAVCIERL